MESKIKLLKVLDILSATDPAHPITASRVCELLLESGIEAERKSVCRDINTLIKYGYKIELCHDNKLGYYMVDGKAKKTVVASRPTVTVTLEYTAENEKAVEAVLGKKSKTIDEEAVKAEYKVEKDALYTRLLELGEIAQIVEPENIREDFMALMEKTLAYYKKPKTEKRIDVWLL